MDEIWPVFLLVFMFMQIVVDVAFLMTIKTQMNINRLMRERCNILGERIDFLSGKRARDG